ncbi:MAG: hypothetical protein AB9873_03940 [Syntrophobacteraceae bacterium]
MYKLIQKGRIMKRALAKEKDMRRRLAFAFVFLFLLAGLTVQAQAQVTLGPIVADPTSPQDGFPLWVQDSLGNFASLCLGAGCTGVVNPDGTLNEAFYYFAGADIPFNAGGLTGTMLAEYFVEAVGPDPGPPAAGAALVNGSRYRARLDAPGVAPAGGLTFTVSNPWSGPGVPRQLPLPRVIATRGTRPVLTMVSH